MVSGHSIVCIANTDTTFTENPPKVKPFFVFTKKTLTPSPLLLYPIVRVKKPKPKTKTFRATLYGNNKKGKKYENTCSSRPQTRATIGNNGGQSCPSKNRRSPDRNQSNGHLPYRRFHPQWRRPRGAIPRHPWA